jgi:hypothetical protein
MHTAMQQNANAAQRTLLLHLLLDNCQACSQPDNPAGAAPTAAPSSASKIYQARTKKSTGQCEPGAARGRLMPRTSGPSENELYKLYQLFKRSAPIPSGRDLPRTSQPTSQHHLLNNNALQTAHAVCPPTPGPAPRSAPSRPRLQRSAPLSLLSHSAAVPLTGSRALRARPWPHPQPCHRPCPSWAA